MALRFRESNTRLYKGLTLKQFTCYQLVIEIIADKLGKDISSISANSKLQDDLGVDSLDGVELIMAFEDTFDIEITDEDADSLGQNCTVSQLCKYLENRV